jgi:hypothetical protein
MFAIGPLLMAAFKIAITPFLTSFGSGLGSHAAEWVWTTVSGAGHQQIAANMKGGTATADEQRTAQQVVAHAVADPVRAQELHQATATNPVAQPIAQSYAGLLAVQPEVWNEFASGSSTLIELAESRARTFGWSREQLEYDETSHCPVGGEAVPFLGVTYIDVQGKTFLTAWVFRPSWNVWVPGRGFIPYAITAHCPNGHQWQVYAS